MKIAIARNIKTRKEDLLHWCRSSLIGLVALISCSTLVAQSIPQPVFKNGQPSKINEVPSKEGVLVIELVLRGLNEPQSAVWVPLRSVSKDYIDRYNRFSNGKSGVWIISELKGGIWVLFEGTLFPLLGLPSDFEKLGEGGYFDLLYNPWVGRIFLSYAKRVSLSLSTVSVLTFQLRYTQRQFIANGLQEIFQAQPPLEHQRGYGGSLSATQEFLYIGLGSGGQPEEAQNLQSHWGTINKISLHPKGSEQERQHKLLPIFPEAISYLAPEFSHNPEFGSVMVSIGHGDINSLYWDPYQQRMWVVEQLRQRNGTVEADELNLLGEGRNYGWGTTVPASSQPSQNSGQSPILSWERSYGWSSVLALPPNGTSGHNMFQAWAGDLLVTSLQGQSLYRMVSYLDPTQESGFRLVFREQMLNGYFGALRWVGLGPDGAIYLLSYSYLSDSGQMLRLSPKSRMFPK